LILNALERNGKPTEIWQRGLLLLADGAATRDLETERSGRHTSPNLVMHVLDNITLGNNMDFDFASPSKISAARGVSANGEERWHG